MIPPRPFNELRPLTAQEYPALFAAIHDYCAREHITVPELYVGNVDRQLIRNVLEGYMVWQCSLSQRWTGAQDITIRSMRWKNLMPRSSPLFIMIHPLACAISSVMRLTLIQNCQAAPVH